MSLKVRDILKKAKVIRSNMTRRYMKSWTYLGLAHLELVQVLCPQVGQNLHANAFRVALQDGLFHVPGQELISARHRGRQRQRQRDREKARKYTNHESNGVFLKINSIIWTTTWENQPSAKKIPVWEFFVKIFSFGQFRAGWKQKQKSLLKWPIYGSFKSRNTLAQHTTVELWPNLSKSRTNNTINDLMQTALNAGIESNILALPSDKDFKLETCWVAGPTDSNRFKHTGITKLLQDHGLVELVWPLKMERDAKIATKNEHFQRRKEGEKATLHNKRRYKIKKTQKNAIPLPVGDAKTCKVGNVQTPIVYTTVTHLHHNRRPCNVSQSVEGDNDEIETKYTQTHFVRVWLQTADKVWMAPVKTKQ